MASFKKAILAPVSWLLPVVIVFALALIQVQVANQVTGLGYEIATLKNQEAELLKERGHLQVELSKLTSKQNLYNMSETLTTQSKASVDVAGN